jgi:hypothetical protein
VSRLDLDTLRARAQAWLPGAADDDTPERDAALERAAAMQDAPAELALSFALNAWLSAIADAPDPWPQVPALSAAHPVEVVQAADAPLFQAMGALVGARLGGAEVRAVVSSAEAVVLSAFWSFDEQITVEAESKGRIPHSFRVEPDAGRCSVALLDGRETDDEYEALAQDILALDGRGEQSVRLVCAPDGLAPDALLQACANVRALLPSSSSSVARLRMAVAFAERSGVPCAFLDDYSLLITRGEPDVLAPGNVRWVVADTDAQVEQALTAVWPPSVTQRADSKRYSDIQARLLGEALRPAGIELVGGQPFVDWLAALG